VASHPPTLEKDGDHYLSWVCVTSVMVCNGR
jgi:hypothetical protein